MARSSSRVSRKSRYPRLIGITRNVAGKAFLLRTFPLMIGRANGNDVIIRVRGVSRRHARIAQAQPGAITIADLQSTNGVRVNGYDYGKVELRGGDCIDLGRVRLLFVPAHTELALARRRSRSRRS